MTHAPTPWKAGGNYQYDTVLQDANGISIASGGNNRSLQGEALQATLRHAARCVNAHDELVAALQMAVKCLDLYGQPSAQSAIKAARAALAKVA